MSDTADEMRGDLAATLAKTYKGLATTCLNLPVPVALPSGFVDADDAVAGVRRLMDISEEEPMPEDIRAALFSACAFWLGADDLFRLLHTKEFNTARAYSCAANLIMCENSLEDVVAFLLGQQE